MPAADQARSNARSRACMTSASSSCLVVVAEQVQHSVHEQEIELLLDGVPVLFGLGLGDFGRDHDVAEVTGSSGSLTAHRSSHSNDSTSVGPSLPRYRSLSSLISARSTRAIESSRVRRCLLAVEHERREPLERASDREAQARDGSRC